MTSRHPTRFVALFVVNPPDNVPRPQPASNRHVTAVAAHHLTMSPDVHPVVLFSR
jgi:hypothetical protein